MQRETARDTSRPQNRWASRSLVFGVAASLSLAAPLAAMAVPNQAPQLSAYQFSGFAGQPATILWSDIFAQATDPEGDSFASLDATLPAGSSGTVSFDPLGVTYTPAPGFIGFESVTYTVQDATGAQSSAPINVDIQANDGYVPPIAAADSYVATSGSTLVVPATTGLLANDTPGLSPLALDLATKTAHGVLTYSSDNGGSFSYKPAKGYVGTDSFRYRLYDFARNFYTDYGTVTIDVQAPPAATGVSFVTPPAALSGKASTVSAQLTWPAGILYEGVLVNLSIDGVKLSSAETNPAGKVQIPFTYPAVGSHTMTLAAVGGKSSTVNFTSLSAVASVSSIALGVPAGKPGQVVNLIAKVNSSNATKSGAALTVYINNKKVATKLTDVNGMAKIPVKLPSVAGKHSVRVVSGTKSVTKVITLGKGQTAKISKLKTVKAKKTETIKGSFGTTKGKVVIKVTAPNGKVSTKTVSLSSKGKFSYKYKTSKKGTYKVTVRYVATATSYGVKEYKASFKAK